MTLARQIEQMSAQLDGFVESALSPAERL
jgi:hypothetical protein